MRVILVEDEITATKKLTSLLNRVRPGIEVLATHESVKDTVNWIRQGQTPDIAFFDIQLADDVSFEIFKQCEVNFPVIFITAYDNYLLQAFEQNTIHYLLKPITETKVREAVEKLERMAGHFSSLNKHPNRIDSKEKLLIRKGMSYVPISINQIAYVFSEHKVSFVKDHGGYVYLADQSLSDLEKVFDPQKFFRANRQYLINLQAIDKYRSIEHSKIKLELKPETAGDVIISKENAVVFRKWIKEMV